MANNSTIPYENDITNSGTSSYTGIIAHAVAGDWNITNTATGQLTFTGEDYLLPSETTPIQLAILNSTAGQLNLGNDGLLTLNGAISNSETGAVVMNNSGTVNWSGQAGTGGSGSGPALLNSGVDAHTELTNQSTGVYIIDGYLLNQNGGNITINNAGDFSLTGTTVTLNTLSASGSSVSLGAVDSSATGTISDTNIVITNTGTMNLTGALYNDTNGSISVNNSGNFTLIAGTDSYTVRNLHDGAITLINDLTANPQATMEITGNIVNRGHGQITITDFTSINGSIYGEHIHLNGSGVLNGAVVGNITATDTAATINSITITGAGTLQGAWVTPEIIDDVNHHKVAIIGAAGSIDTYAGSVDVTIGEIPPEVSTFGISLLAENNFTTVSGNAVFGGVNTNVSGSVSGSIGTGVTITGNVIGGGYSTTRNANVGGTVTLNINGAVGSTIIQGDVYGGGYAGTASFTANVGTAATPAGTNITVKNATIGGSIYGSGRGSTSTVYGTTTITLSGSVNFTGTNAQIAPSYDTATVTGYKQLNFTDYVGSVNATVSSAFQEVSFNKDTQKLTFSVTQDWSAIGKYTFDITERNYDLYNTTALVDLGNVTLNYNATLAVNLKFAGQSTDYTYKLATGTNLNNFNGKTITVYDKSNGSNVTLSVGGSAVQSSKNQNVYYQARVLSNGELWLNCYNTNSAVLLIWPQNYWDRYAPGTAIAVAVAAGATTYLGAANTYTDNTNTTSAKGSVTLNATTSVLYGGRSTGSLTGSTWVNIKASSGGTVYGGGGANSGTISKSTNIYVYKSGTSAAPTLGAIYGGGAGGTITEGTYIDIAGATINGNVYGGGTGGTINGGTNVIFAGLSTDLNFTGTVFGNGSAGTVNGTKALTFGDIDGNNTVRGYSAAAGALGDFAATFQNFDVLNINSTSAVKFTSTATGRVFQATTWNVFGQLDGNSQLMSSSGAALNLNVKAGGVSLTPFRSNTDTNVTNYGSIHGVYAFDKTLNISDNSGLLTGILTGKSLTLVNNAAGTLNNVLVGNSSNALTSLNITNASSNTNTMTFSGNVNAAASADWVVNNGTLTLNNTGGFAVSGTAAAIRNNGGTLTWNNSGTGEVTYTGRWVGTAAGGAPATNSVISNTSTSANGFVWNGLWDAASKRNVAIAALTPTAGSSLSLTNGTGATMQINGAVYALSVGNYTITNNGTLKIFATDSTDNTVRSAINSIGTGGMVITNNASLETNFIRNSWLYADGSENAGDLAVNNNAGTMLVHGRKIQAADSAYIFLQEPDLGIVMDVLTGQKEAMDNVGTNATLGLTNAAGATYTAEGVVSSLLATKLQITNAGTMNIGDSSATPDLNAAGRHNSLYNYKTTQGILVDNSGILNLYGNVLNQGSGAITLTNSGTTTLYGLLRNTTAAAGAGITVNNNNGTMTINTDDSKIAVLNESGGTITLVNKKNMQLLGSIQNISTATSGYGIDIDNTTAGASLSITADTNGYGVLNNSASNIRIQSIAANTLTIVGNIVNRLSGSILIADYTSITGDIVGKNITLTGAGTVNGNVTGGEIQTGETSTVDITGGTIGSSGNVIAGVTGNNVAGATTVTVSGNATINSDIIGGGNSVAVTGRAATTVGGTGSAVVLNGNLFGGGSQAAVGSTLVNINAGVSTGASATIYGGGSNGTVNGNATLNITNATVGSIYGGGFSGDVQGNTQLTMAGTTVGANQWIVGGGSNAAVTGNSTLNLSGTLNNAIIVGGGKGGNIGGSVDMTVASQYTNHIYGGGYGSNVGGSVTLTLTGGSDITGRVYAGGAGSVANSNAALYATSVTIKSNVTHKAAVYAGSFSSATLNAAKTISGNVAITVEDTATIGTLLYGGGYSNNSGNTDTITGKSVITVGNCAINNFIYGGGYANYSSTTVISGGSDITLSASQLLTGVVIYGGGRAGGSGALSIVGTSGDTTTGTHITLNAQTVGGDIHGGGFASGSGISKVYGGSHITLNGATVKNIYGGGVIGDVNSRAYIYDGTYITIGAGAITGDVYGGGRSAYAIISGGSNIIFTDSSLVFTGTVSGQGNASGAHSGTRNLNFGAGFNGNFNAAITNFDHVTVESLGQVALTQSQALSNVNHWEFDLFDRDIAQSATALLDWVAGSNNFAGDRIDLTLNKNSTATSWSLLHTGSSSLLNGWSSANYFINGIDLATATGVGGDFHGWQLSAIDSDSSSGIDTLKFAKIA